MNKINYFFAKLKCKNDFKRAINHMIKIDEKKINSIHVNYYYGMVVNIYKYLRIGFDEESNLTFFLKKTKIRVYLNAKIIEGYEIKFKKEID
jgi:hypothetical protein